MVCICECVALAGGSYVCPCVRVLSPIHLMLTLAHGALSLAFLCLGAFEACPLEFYF